MGAKRKVDEKLYEKLSKELNSPKDDKKVMEKYNLGQSTVRAIRNSWCYDDYLTRTIRVKGEDRTKRNDRYYAIVNVFSIIAVLAGCAGVFFMVKWIIGKLFGA